MGSFNKDAVEAKYKFLDRLEKRGVKAMMRARIEKIIEGLATPSKDWMSTRTYAGEFVGQSSDKWFYRMLDSDEREELESIALNILRTRYAGELAEVDRALIKKAKAGSKQHMELAYQRFERWGKTDKAQEKLEPNENGGNSGQVVVDTGIQRPPSRGKPAGNGLQTT